MIHGPYETDGANCISAYMFHSKLFVTIACDCFSGPNIPRAWSQYTLVLSNAAKITRLVSAVCIQRSRHEVTLTVHIGYTRIA